MKRNSSKNLEFYALYIDIMYVQSVLRVYVHIYITLEMLVLHNKYLYTGFKFLYVVKCHTCIM
jgi:hypothetical protein